MNTNNVDGSTIDQYWQQDPLLNQVMGKIESYESWVETDPGLLNEMSASVVKALNSIEGIMSRHSGNSDHRELSEFAESLLMIMGFMPAKQALYYLDSFQRYEPFFNELSAKLNDSPPLKDYAKSLLGRAIAIQQRALALSIYSDDNFNRLTQALELVFAEDRKHA